MSKCFFEELYDCLFGDEKRCACCGKPLKPSPKPLPKLTVKIFRDPEYKNYRYAVVDAYGTAHLFHHRPRCDKLSGLWWPEFLYPLGERYIGRIYDASDWQNSLIKNPYIELEEKEYNLKGLKEKLRTQATNPLLEIRKLEAEIRELKNKIGESE